MVAEFVAFSLLIFIQFNVFLGLFNLLPFPPFDGSHIVQGLLPLPAARAYQRLRPYGFPLLFVVILVIPYLFPEWDVVEKLVLPPVIWAIGLFLDLASSIAGA